VKRDFLTLADLTADEHRALMYRTKALKEARKQHRVMRILDGRTLVCIFEKASTRTRLSFEAAMAQLGGHSIVLPVTDSSPAATATSSCCAPSPTSGSRASPGPPPCRSSTG
jgi:ornithine carbamoyltransferase